MVSQGILENRIEKRIVWIVAAVSFWLLTGCALNNGMKSNELHSFGADGNSVAAFQSTVYPVVQQYCSSCHGADQTPLFASDSVQTAYKGALAAVNFTAPAASRLVGRLANDSHNCWSDCLGNSQVMTAAIERWVALANGDGDDGPPRKELPTATVPSVLPTPPPTGANNAYTTMTFPLDSVGFAGGLLTIDIQSYSAANYGVRNPRLSGLTAKARVKNLRLLVNGLYRPNESYYTFIDVTMSPPGASLITSQPMLVLKASGPGVDTITPSFELFEVAP